MIALAVNILHNAQILGELDCASFSLYSVFLCLQHNFIVHLLGQKQLSFCL